LIVEADELDVLREPRLIEADPRYRGWSLTDVRAELAGDFKCLILAAIRPCVFLESTCRCAIYPTRPNVCVAMQAGDAQCQQARASAGLPVLQPRSRGVTGGADDES
jgi:Fe-S-cluster containining protein